jgi:hypothetical protein
MNPTELQSILEKLQDILDDLQVHSFYQKRNNYIVEKMGKVIQELKNIEYTEII